MLAATGLWLLYRGVFFSRARGTPRCRRCWYPLIVTAQGTTTGETPAAAPAIEPSTCAECGTVHTKLSQTLRTRRSKVRITAGVLSLLLALPLPLVPGIRANGLWPSLPEWIVYIAAVQTGEGSPAWKELERRVLGIFATPSTFAPARRLITASIVHTRSVWPIGTPPRISTPRLREPFAKGGGNPPRFIPLQLLPDSPVQTVPQLPSHEVIWVEPTLAVCLPQALVSAPAAWAPQIGGSINTLQVLFDASWSFSTDINTIITPVSSEAVDAAIRRYLAPTLIRGMSTNLPAISLIRGGARPPELAGLALGLRITIRRGDAIAATTWCWHAGDNNRLNGRADMPPVLLTLATTDKQLTDAFDAMTPTNPPGPEWTLTIESDQVLALRDFQANKCWQGKIVWPLAEALQAR